MFVFQQYRAPAGRSRALGLTLAAAMTLGACSETPVATAPATPAMDAPRASMVTPTPTTWYMRRADGGFDAVPLGLSDDIPVQGDYDGDGKTDVAVYRPSTGRWFILRSSDLLTLELPYGAVGDRPVPADYDGDGRTDLAVFRPGSQQWYILTSGNGQTGILTFGLSTDIPVPADYDGDGKADVAVFRPGSSSASWWIRRSSTAVVTTGAFGLPTDVPVPDDFDGDGKADLAVWRASSAQFWISRSSDGAAYPVTWGNSTDTPVIGDYDGDGKADIAIFRSSTAQWWIQQSTNGSLNLITFGLPGDRAVPGDYANAGRLQPAVRRDAPPPPTPQSITFTTSLPLMRAALGTTYTVGATGGASGNPVVFSILTPAVCSIAGTTVSFNALGTCTIAANQAGNASFDPAPQATQSITVAYPFAFAGPASRAGNNVRIAFDLSGDRGLNILAPGYPLSQQVACAAPNAAIGDAVPTEPGASGLSYDAETGLYTYKWKTERKAWEGTCRKIVIRLTDGVDRTMILQF